MNEYCCNVFYVTKRQLYFGELYEQCPENNVTDVYLHYLRDRLRSCVLITLLRELIHYVLKECVRSTVMLSYVYICVSNLFCSKA